MFFVSGGGRTPVFGMSVSRANVNVFFPLGDHAKKRLSSRRLVLLKKISDPTGARIFRARVESEIFFKITNLRDESRFSA